MRRALIAVLLAGFLTVVGLYAAEAAHATKPDPGHKVTLCHRTGSATNPYVVVTTDIASDGYVKGGHTGHDQIGNGLGGDIIPAYTYQDFSFPGKNLDFVFPNGETGAEVLAAGCVLTNESPSPTPTPTDSPTPTPTDTPTPPPTSTPPTTSTPTPPPVSHHVAFCVKHPSASQCQHTSTAFTGFDKAAAGVLAGILGAIGGVSLWLSRNKKGAFSERS